MPQTTATTPTNEPWSRSRCRSGEADLGLAPDASPLARLATVDRSTSPVVVAVGGAVVRRAGGMGGSSDAVGRRAGGRGGSRDSVGRRAGGMGGSRGSIGRGRPLLLAGAMGGSRGPVARGGGRRAGGGNRAAGRLGAGGGVTVDSFVTVIVSARRAGAGLADRVRNGSELSFCVVLAPLSSIPNWAWVGRTPKGSVLSIRLGATASWAWWSGRSRPSCDAVGRWPKTSVLSMRRGGG